MEGIALRKGWITADKMKELAQPMLKNQYGQYLLKVINSIYNIEITKKMIKIEEMYNFTSIDKKIIRMRNEKYYQRI